MGNLNSEKDFDELKDGLRTFFSKKSLEVADVRIGASRYVPDAFLKACRGTSHP